MKIWIDYQDDGTEDQDWPSTEVHVEQVPRIGEKIGVRQPSPMEGSKHYALDYVIDVRHYFLIDGSTEIRVMTASRP